MQFPGEISQSTEMEVGEVAPGRAGSKCLKKAEGGRAKVYSGARIGSPRVRGVSHWPLVRYWKLTTTLLVGGGL